MDLTELIGFLEQVAPPLYQEDYDNAGLIVGRPDGPVTGVLVCLDSTEAVIEEAVRRGCNVVVAHHPIIFRGLKRLNGNSYVERTVMLAIKNDIAIYAIHTNLDNVFHRGVNSRIAERLELRNTRLLAPKREMKKLSGLVPALHRESVEEALIAAGADQVVFTHQSSYSTSGVHNGDGFEAEYLRLETLFPSGSQRAILQALRHSQPDQRVSFDTISVENESPTVGAGIVGELAEPMEENVFLYRLKERMQSACVRHTPLLGRPVRRVAVCGGAGSFLLNRAIALKADVFVSADFKYHEFFDADGRILVADIGHFESEQFTIRLLHELISEKFSSFATYFTQVNTNPVNYLC